MQASLFSSLKHRTQGFVGDGSIADDVRFFVGGSVVAAAFASLDDEDISLSLVLEVSSARVDELAACSRS